MGSKSPTKSKRLRVVDSSREALLTKLLLIHVFRDCKTAREVVVLLVSHGTAEGLLLDESEGLSFELI